MRTRPLGGPCQGGTGRQVHRQSRGLSDSHGRGKTAAPPTARHAKLAVNTGFAVAGFLIDTHIEKH
ncbi:abortive infection family protein [Mycobacteroides abscessus]|uniref:abortive infection family protein n=1 Tax=Mycobacteroides abscessus TaxID=36809 RepID=UPI0020B795BC|nr:abortive infection family protein [Mycobacteroides abscessus]